MTHHRHQEGHRLICAAPERRASFDFPFPAAPDGQPCPGRGSRYRRRFRDGG